MVEDSENIEGWQVDSEEVRQMATKMGVPTTQSLPEVIIVGEKVGKSIQTGPQLHTDSSGESPSGYFITIPESMLEDVSGTHYILGPRTGENIRHELAHFLDHVETGSPTGSVEDPYKEAVREISANLRAGVKRPSWRLALIIRTLVEDYGLSSKVAGEIVGRAAMGLGINKWTIGRAKRLYREGRLGWGGEK